MHVPRYKEHFDYFFKFIISKFSILRILDKRFSPFPSHLVKLTEVSLQGNFVGILEIVRYRNVSVRKGFNQFTDISYSDGQISRLNLYGHE